MNAYRYFFLAFLIIISAASFGQTSDSILRISTSVDLKFSPKTPVTRAKITFIKFKDEYGIQLYLLTPNKYIPHIFIDCIYSLGLKFTDGKKLVLNIPAPDMELERLPNYHVFQQAYYIDNASLQKLRTQGLVDIFASHGCRPFTLRIKKNLEQKF